MFWLASKASLIPYHGEPRRSASTQGTTHAPVGYLSLFSSQFLAKYFKIFVFSSMSQTPNIFLNLFFQKSWGLLQILPKGLAGSRYNFDQND